MITTKDDLKRTISLERNLYLEGKGIIHCLVHSKDYQIFKFQKYLRKEEYFGNKTCGLWNKMHYAWYKRRKNILGQRLGYDIPRNCFEEGLHIHHVGAVTVNASARIGKNCEIAGNVCIGTMHGEPRIGNQCFLGYGSIIIGDIELADRTVVGAGAVVTKSCKDTGCKLAGVPASIV